MRKRKGIISLVLALCLGISLIPCTAFAAGTVIEVKAPTTMPKAGETFTVTVNLTGNTGFSAAQLTLGFDKSAMQCTSAKTGTLLSGTLSATNPNASNGAIIAAATTNNISSDGNLATFTFTASKDVTSFDFSLADITLSDANGKGLTYTVSGATEKRVEPVTPVTPIDPVVPVTPTDPVTPISPGDPKQDPEEGREVVVIVPTETSFTDTVGHWAAAYIEKAVELKIFGGYGGGIFKPDLAITRGQFITVLYRIAGSPEVSINTPFTDIDSQSQEFKKAISWGYEKGYINGKSTTKFAPEDLVTRQEAMKILFGYSGGVSGGELMFTSIYDGGFKDSSQIASWAKPAMYWGYYNKIINGTSATTLGPNDTATRAQIAKILVDYLENYSK